MAQPQNHLAYKVPHIIMGYKPLHTDITAISTNFMAHFKIP